MDISPLHQCHMCKYNTKRKYDLKKHILRMHGSERRATKEIRMEKHLCDICGKAFSTRSGIRIHTKDKHTLSFRFICSVCGAGFNRLWDYTAHVSKHNKVKLEKCDDCGKSFRHKQTLHEHRKKYHPHDRSEVVNCECVICGRGFSSQDALREHVKSAHLDRRYECSCCGKVFACQSSFKYHVNVCKK